eukprot:8081607-Karenia_brevis.AAC.1
MGATQKHLMDMNWEMQWHQGQIRLKDQAGNIWQTNPQYGVGLLLRAMMEGARETLLWQKAAQHRHGIGMEGGLDMTL